MALKKLPYTVHNTAQSTTDQRLDEVAGLLAAGLLRLRLRNLAGAGEPEKRAQKPLDAGAPPERSCVSNLRSAKGETSK